METPQHREAHKHDNDVVSASILEAFTINGIKYKIKKVSNSAKEGKKLGLNIKNPIPIYFVEGSGIFMQGAYHKKRNIIFMFDNADAITLKHEIIHSLEFNKPIPNELYEFYELAKSKISEESFDDMAVSFNFKKDIHEFIADGYSKTPFIVALKKEGLYEEFLQKTKYIFE